MLPSIEVNVNRDSLAELGYTAFWQAREANFRGHTLIPWDSATADMRNFWRAWAHQFVMLHIGK